MFSVLTGSFDLFQMAVPWTPRGLTDQELILLIDLLQRALLTQDSDASATTAISDTRLGAASVTLPRKRRLEVSQRKNVPRASKPGKTTACKNKRYVSSGLPDVVPMPSVNLKTRDPSKDGLASRLAVPDLWPPTAVRKTDGNGRMKMAANNRKFRLDVFPPAEADRTAECKDIGRLLRACAKSLEEDDVFLSKSSSTSTIVWPATALLEALLGDSRLGLLTAGVGLLCWALTTSKKK